MGSNPAGRANSFKGLIERSTTPYRLVATFPAHVARMSAWTQSGRFDSPYPGLRPGSVGGSGFFGCFGFFFSRLLRC